MLRENGCPWLTPIILATWDAEIRRILVQDQLGQIVCETPSPKQPEQNGLQVWLKQTPILRKKKFFNVCISKTTIKKKKDKRQTTE
jgi:hypothetical protein